ncbi:MAG: threonine dehydratase [Pseudonocardiales bacterium]|nr:threonine dehydratase [Pseudonocardiales bacterium]
MGNLIDIADVRAAAERVAPYVLRTPTLPSPGLTAHFAVPVTLKLEQLQRSGSFKARGAFAKLTSLSDAERAAGVVAVSGGNHGIAVADAAGALGVAATVVMPESAPARSVELAKASGADVRLTPTMDGAFAMLHELVAAGATLVHPFDDPVVSAAQGTAGLEFAIDAPTVTDVLVSIGGGGLIAGVATVFRALAPHVRVWGVETEGADAMTLALTAGEPVATPLSSIVTTLSAPAVSDLTLEHARELLTDVLVVSDAEAVAGTVTLAEQGKVWAEPAAGCLVPAAHRVLERVGADNVHLGLLVCGGNATVAAVTAWAGRLTG